jgi:hypothetical protein
MIKIMDQGITVVVLHTHISLFPIDHNAHYHEVAASSIECLIELFPSGDSDQR